MRWPADDVAREVAASTLAAMRARDVVEPDEAVLYGDPEAAVRDGSWLTEAPNYAYVSIRQFEGDGQYSEYMGFRLARSVQAEPDP